MVHEPPQNVAETTNITIADVARIAGVSRSTVSRILNGRPDVSAATRLRVQQVIEDLGFRPHALAQRLVTGKSRTIALLHPQERPSPKSLSRINLLLNFIIGAAQAAEDRGYFLNIMTSPVTPNNLLDLYKSVQVDGVILMEIYLHDWRVDLLREAGFPFVMIGRCADNDGLSYADIYFEAAFDTICSHLAALGHRNIGVLGFPDALRASGYGPAVRTHAGCVQGAANHGLNMFYQEVNFSADDGADATLTLLDAHPEITAIIPGSVEGGVTINALRQRGLRVPEDVSVTGLVEESAAKVTTPPLTSVNFRSFDAGHQAATMLLDKLAQVPISADQVLLDSPLVIRESTGPARG